MPGKFKQAGPLHCEAQDVYRPKKMRGPLGIRDSKGPNDGTLYKDQLRQLHIEIGKRLRARAISNWALSFFSKEPDIPEIAKALSAKVDSALIAVNKLGLEHLQSLSILDLSNWFPGLSFRERIDYAADMYLKRSRTQWLITYRIPRAVAVATQAVEDKRGKCEEHAFLAVYLLTLGQMIQNMPFGKLKKDIYYTGAATPRHAMVILVKGAEFKEAILMSKKKSGKIDLEWLRKNTKYWGKSAWIVDGWDTNRANKLTTETISLDYTKTQAFRRDPASGGISKWDVTMSEMVNRVAKDYKINQPE